MKSIAIALCGACALLAPVSAAAAPGDLDPTFSGDGFLTADLDGGVSSAFRDVLVQPDGRIVAVGFRQSEEIPGTIDVRADLLNGAVARYNADGSPDTSFGGDGDVAPELSGYTGDLGGYEEANAGALQADGKIVVGVTTGESQYVVARLNPDGSIDETFATGGIATIPIGSDYARGTFVRDIELVDDGRILVTGNAGRHAGIVRLNGDGSLDQSFSSDGRAYIPHTYGFDAAVDRKRRILVAGTRDNRPRGSAGQPAEGMSITRLRPKGAIDRSFAGEGVVTPVHGPPGLTEATALALQADRKVVVAGYSRGDFAVARITRKGRLDGSFSDNGRVITNLGQRESGSGPFDEALAIALGPNGTVALAGLADTRRAPTPALARYTRNGKLDRSFSGDGRLLFRFGFGAQSCGDWSDVASVGGDLVAAGAAIECQSAGPAHSSAALARFQG
jgi:uncharacterized delta-60 repeat protein